MIRLVRFYLIGYSSVFPYLMLSLSELFTGVAQLQIGSNIESDLVADSVVAALESAVTNPATLQAIEEEIKVRCSLAPTNNVFFVTYR